MISDRHNVKVLKRPSQSGQSGQGQGNPSNVIPWGQPPNGKPQQSQGKPQKGQQKPGEGRGSSSSSGSQTLGDRSGLTVGGKTLDTHIEGKGNKPKALQTPGNDPKYQPDTKEKTEQEAIADTKQKIMDAHQEAEKARASGGGTPRWFDKGVLRSKTDWKRILNDFITSNSQHYYDWGRPNKRAMAAGYYAPKSSTMESDIEGVIAVDTSGSMTGPVLKQFITEIVAILDTFQKAKLTILFWHTSVYKRVDIDTSEHDVQSAAEILAGTHAESGGTELGSIDAYFKKEGIDTSNMHMLVCTDGHVESNPRLPDMAAEPIFLINSDSGTDEKLKGKGDIYFVDIEHMA